MAQKTEHPRTKHNSGYATLSQGPGAQAAYRAYPSDQPKASSILGQAKFALSDYETAAKLYRQLVDKNPAEAAAIADLGHRLAIKAVNARKYEDAVQLARRVLDLQKDRSEVLATLAIARLSATTQH